MRPDYSKMICGLFAARAHDCTPASAQTVATILFAPAVRDGDLAAGCASVLSEAERRQAASYLTHELRAHFCQRRAFRRYCGTLAMGSALPLSRIEFRTTEKGRPYLSELPGFRFSFSSCRLGFLGAWSSTNGIGVDLEDQARSIEPTELAEKYFSQAEAEAVERAGNAARQNTFLQLWTLKEAALKSIGEGLPFGLDAFEFDLSAGLRVVDAPGAYGGAAQFRAYAIDIAGGCAALAVRGDDDRTAVSSRATPPAGRASAAPELG